MISTDTHKEDSKVFHLSLWHSGPLMEFIEKLVDFSATLLEPTITWDWEDGLIFGGWIPMTQEELDKRADYKKLTKEKQIQAIKIKHDKARQSVFETLNEYPDILGNILEQVRMMQMSAGPTDNTKDFGAVLPTDGDNLNESGTVVEPNKNLDVEFCDVVGTQDEDE